MKFFFVYITLLATAVTATASDQIQFETAKTWKQIKEKAKKENKMIFFDAYATWCGPCKYMDKNVYTDREVAGYYNNNYINVKMDMEEGEGLKLAEEFEVTAYPTLLFFSPEGKMVHRYIGAMEAEEFLDLGKNSKSPDRQYYTLKEKAVKNQLSDDLFERWAEQAKDMKDDGRHRIVNNYLKAKGGLLADKAAATITIYYADSLSTKDLSYLYSNKAKLQQLMGWKPDKTEDALYNKLFSFGLKTYEKTRNNIDSFIAVIKAVAPYRVSYARYDLKIREALIIDENADEGMDLIITGANDKVNQLTLEEVATLVFDNHSNFRKSHYQKLYNTLETFKLRNIDKDNEFWLYLLQWISGVQIGKDAEAKVFAKKAYQHPQLPGEYKDLLEEQYPDFK